MDWKDSVRLAPSDIAKKAIHFCENTECEDCLVAIEGLEHRTRYEKEVEHVPIVIIIYKTSTTPSIGRSFRVRRPSGIWKSDELHGLRS